MFLTGKLKKCRQCAQKSIAHSRETVVHFGEPRDGFLTFGESRLNTAYFLNNQKIKERTPLTSRQEVMGRKKLNPPRLIMMSPGSRPSGIF
jgi:hypothetical protein